MTKYNKKLPSKISWIIALAFGQFTWPESLKMTKTLIQQNKLKGFSLQILKTKGNGFKNGLHAS